MYRKNKFVVVKPTYTGIYLSEPQDQGKQEMQTKRGEIEHKFRRKMEKDFYNLSSEVRLRTEEEFK